ncbi:MAG: tRNA lysidine(34) synthetase TilS [Pseudomonadota bacterium]
MKTPELLKSPPPATAYCVAYSGGMDSTVLLHLAHAARLPNLSAIHVHHGLQASADGWAAQCRAQCAALGVPLQVVQVAVDAQHPQGPEAAAREARYAALREKLPTAAVLLTAHHAGDQAETILLRLLRGTGVEGLSAMSMHSALGEHTLWRPLLRTSREALLDYAECHGLQWIEDPHNRDPRYARSWLRAEVMPALRRRWPDADTQLARAADHAADATLLLTRLADDLLHRLQGEHGGLSVSGLLQLHAAERRLVLRHWLQGLGLPPPFAQTLQQLETDVLPAGATAMPLLRWPGAEFRRYRDSLFAGPTLAELPDDLCFDWDGRGPLLLPAGLGELSTDTPQPMQVRFAVPGLRIRLAGASHSRSLKQLSQENAVPPWWRSRLPIIFVDRTVVSIAGHWNTQGAPALSWRVQESWGLPASWMQ